MHTNDLQKLHRCAVSLLRDARVAGIVEGLKEKVGDSEEPFVWSVIDRALLPQELPGNIKSVWLFVLKNGVPSGCHFHPNSVQHMVMAEGQGMSTIGDENRRMKEWRPTDRSLDDVWYIIDAGVEHEFFPEKMDMVVISFHTCEAHELIEVSCSTGKSRVYETGKLDARGDH